MTRTGPGTPPPEGGEIQLEIDRLAAEGLGVGRHQGFVVFVPYTAPGDLVRARVQRVRARYGEAEPVELVRPGPDRRQPPCPAFGRCGGCALQHLDYPAQLRWKRQWVVDALERLGGLRGVEVAPTLPSDSPWFYRNKATIPLRRLGGRTVAGFYARGTHRVVPFPAGEEGEPACGIQHPRINQAVAAATRWLNGPGRAVPPFDPETGRGLLRHLVVRVGVQTGEVLVGVVVHGPGFPGEEAFAEHVAARVPGVVGVVKNVNTAWINQVLGPESTCLRGRPYLLERLAGLRFRVSLASFFQVNPVQAERLYRLALAEAAPAADQWVIDAYSGTGTLALLAARHLGPRGRVTAIEADPAAVADARANARLNGIEGVEFVQGRAEEVLARLADTAPRPPGAVLLDPPRRGCDPAVLEACRRLGPPRIVYVSCNPATLARDLARLCGDGAYRVARVQPVDMFPQTAHVEAVATLVRERPRP